MTVVAWVVLGVDLLVAGPILIALFGLNAVAWDVLPEWYSFAVSFVGGLPAGVMTVVVLLASVATRTAAVVVIRVAALAISVVPYMFGYFVFVFGEGSAGSWVGLVLCWGVPFLLIALVSARVTTSATLPATTMERWAGALGAMSIAPAMVAGMLLAERPWPGYEPYRDPWMLGLVALTVFGGGAIALGIGRIVNFSRRRVQYPM